jgi:hypothetical protein
MSAAIRLACQAEMDKGRRARALGALDEAFAHFERAHILGQRFTWLHVRAHGAMFGVGWQRRDLRELIGQVFRIAAAALLTRLWVPEGNTGGANVSALKPMPMPEDLRALLAQLPEKHLDRRTK